MEFFAIALYGIGALIAFVCSIILLVKAFQTSIWWGLGSIIVPFVALFFVIVHWPVAKKPFLVSLLSIPCFVVALLLAPDLAAEISAQ